MSLRPRLRLRRRLRKRRDGSGVCCVCTTRRQPAKSKTHFDLACRPLTHPTVRDNKRDRVFLFANYRPTRPDTELRHSRTHESLSSSGTPRDGLLQVQFSRALLEGRMARLREKGGATMI
jgi:hypothetical protein